VPFWNQGTTPKGSLCFRLSLDKVLTLKNIWLVVEQVLSLMLISSSIFRAVWICGLKRVMKNNDLKTFDKKVQLGKIAFSNARGIFLTRVLEPVIINIFPQYPIHKVGNMTLYTIKLIKFDRFTWVKHLWSENNCWVLLCCGFQLNPNRLGFRLIVCDGGPNFRCTFSC
jgi:hypothetical protein